MGKRQVEKFSEEILGIVKYQTEELIRAYTKALDLRIKTIDDFWEAIYDVVCQALRFDREKQLRLLVVIDEARSVVAETTERAGLAIKIESLAHSFCGDFSQAIAKGNRSIEYYQGLGNRKEVLRQSANQIFWLVRSGQTAEADQLAKSMVEEVKAFKDQDVANVFYRHWAILASSKREFPLAIERMLLLEPSMRAYQMEDVDEAERQRLDKKYASFLQELGGYYTFVGQTQQAEVMLRQAYALLTDEEGRATQRSRLSINYYYMARLHLTKGELYEARDACHNALQLLGEVADEDEDYLNTVLLLCQILLALHQYQKVYTTVEGVRAQIARIDPRRRDYLFIQAELLAAGASAALQKFDAAHESVARLLNRPNAVKDKWHWFACLVRAQLYCAQGEVERNPQYLNLSREGAEAVYRENGIYPQEHVETALLLARLAIGEGDFAEGHDYLQAISQIDYRPNHLQRAYYYLWGRYYEAQGNQVDALTAYRTAVDLAHFLAKDLTNTVLRVRYFTAEAESFTRLFQHLIAAEAWEELWDRIEQQRAYTLFALSAPELVLDDSPENEALRQRLDALRGKMLELSDFLIQPEVASDLQSTRRHEQLEKEYIDCENQLRQLYRGLQGKTIGEHRALADVQATLAADTVMLTYKIVENQVVVFALAKDRFFALPLDVSAERLARNLTWLEKNHRDFNEAYTERQVDLLPPLVKRANRLFHAFYQDLWEPLEEKLETIWKNVVIVADGVLLYFPFTAMRDNQERHLIERFTFSYVPSGSIYVRCLDRARRRWDSWGAGAVAFGDRGSAEGRLAYALGELRQLKMLIPEIELLVGPKAIRSELYQRVSQAKIVHAALHASRNDQPENGKIYTPLTAHLQLGRDDQGDPVNLYAPEMARFNFWHTDVVYFNACHSAFSKDEGGQVLGLIWAVLTAGAYAMVGAMTAIEDRWSAEMAQHFYLIYLDSGDKQDALHQAQLAVYRQGMAADLADDACWQRHPAVWAPFVVYGYAAGRPA